MVILLVGPANVARFDSGSIRHNRERNVVDPSVTSEERKQDEHRHYVGVMETAETGTTDK